MTDTELATGGSDEAFTPAEQSAWDAYERGEDAPAVTAPEPAGSDAAAAGVPPLATEAAPAAGEPAGAPGEVVDPEADDVDDAEANKGRFVRHGAFHRERERRKALERELNETRERFARGDERLRLLTEAMQGSNKPATAPAQAQPEPEVPPNPSEDIFGYAEWLERQVQDLRTAQNDASEAQKQAVEAQRVESERTAIIDFYRQDVRQAIASDPTVGEAYNHLFGGRVAELEHFGMSREQASETARAEEFDMVRAAIQRKQSPAAMIVHLAKGRGFAPKPAAPAEKATPVESPAEKAARVSAGQAASKSLSAAGGAPAGEVTLEQLASMSEADFERFAANNPRKLAALMGA